MQNINNNEHTVYGFVLAADVVDVIVTGAVVGISDIAVMVSPMAYDDGRRRQRQPCGWFWPDPVGTSEENRSRTIVVMFY